MLNFNPKRILPDAITCGNLLSGTMAVFMATQNHFTLAFGFILLGVFFDFFDGMSARALGVVNPAGVELDSLADVITSGLAPAMMLCCYLRPVIGWWSLIALTMASAAALRLAKFNVDDRQKSSFIGLATPANALFWGGICSMPMAILNWNAMPWILLAFTLVSDLLMVGEIPFFSLKFHNLSWKENAVAYLFLIGCLILIAVCVIEAVRYEMIGFACFAGTGCIIWYVVFNLINLALNPKETQA